MITEDQLKKIEILTSNEVLVADLYDIFNSAIEEGKPKISSVDNNWMLGEKYRAYETGKQIIGRVFISLRNHKRVTVPIPLHNRGI